MRQDIRDFELEVCRDYLGRVSRLIKQALEHDKTTVSLQELVSCVTPTAEQDAQIQAEMREAVEVLIK